MWVILTIEKQIEFSFVWEACRADKRSFGMTYLKIDVRGFLTWVRLNVLM